jgi:hypothetical protein
MPVIASGAQVLAEHVQRNALDSLRRRGDGDGGRHGWKVGRKVGKLEGRVVRKASGYRLVRRIKQASIFLKRTQDGGPR